MTESPLYLGLMSGTSLDGVDIACCRFTPDFSLLGQHYLPMPEALREQLLTLQTPSTNEIHRAQLAGLQLAELYATACQNLLNELALIPEQINAIGCHGQTIRHRPNEGYTLQINQPARLAELCRIDVIADFRSRDVAAGGQGAPLVPGFHAALFQHPEQHRVLLNLGGMANLTNLPPTGPVSGFDCGPANVLLDAWCQQHLGQPYDIGGNWATSGTADLALLEKLLAHPYFDKTPPKSCGREEFNLAWLYEQIANTNKPADVQSTLLDLTVRSVAQAITRYCPGAEMVILCGGGARNRELRGRLAQHLRNTTITDSSAFGLPIDAVEAAAFAWLAERFVNRQAGNLPTVTGAHGPRLLGALYPA